MRRHYMKLTITLAVGTFLLAANAYALLTGALLPFYRLFP